MIYTVPDYYNEFSCTADKCEDTCCAGWEIVIDPTSLKKYKKVQDGFGNCLQNSIQLKKQSFKQYNGRCAFLNDTNLCDLYSELGEKYLCKTCREYPRHTEEYEDCMEMSLSLSCPEVTRMLLNHKERVKFLTREEPNEQEEIDEFEFFNFFLYTQLTDARKYIVGTLQDRSKEIRMRAAMSLVFAHDLQNRIDNQEDHKIATVIKRYQTEKIQTYLENKLNTYQEKSARRYKVMQKQFKLLSKLERLKDEWGTICKNTYELLYRGGEKEYVRNRRKFLAFMHNTKALHNTYEIILEQLFIYFVYGYFLGAVYDGQAYVKMKFAIVNTMLMQELLQARWQQNKTLSSYDLVELIHAYAREIEHSDYNLDKIEDILDEKHEFYLEDMLVTILS